MAGSHRCAGQRHLGGVIARSARLDVVGFAVLAILSGLGGGVIRDTLLQHGTPVALTNYSYVLTALAGAAIAYLIKVEGRAWGHVWPLIDALALGCWASSSAQKTLGVGLGLVAGGAAGHDRRRRRRVRA